MSVTMEVHDHGGVNAYGLHHRLERRLPVDSLLHGLHRVGKVPMRGKGDKTIQMRKVIVVRVSKNVLERYARALRARQQEQAHFLNGIRRRVHPWIDGGIVVGVLLHSQSTPTPPGAVPEVSLIGGVIAGREIAVRRRKN